MKIPPKRLSIDKDSPYFDSEAFNPNIEIKLNGQKQIACVTEYNQCEGWLIRYKKDETGRLIIQNGSLVTEKVNGVVSVCYKD